MQPTRNDVSVATRTLFTGGLVFDGTGSPPAPVDVVIQGTEIVDVGTALDGDIVVDLAGATLFPGIIDAHVHLVFSGMNNIARLDEPFTLPFFRAVANSAATIATGITTVRDAFGADLGLKQAIDTGVIAGPRTMLSINMVSQTGGHNDKYLTCGIDHNFAYRGMPHAIADGPDEVRKVVRSLIRAGAGVIKVAATGGISSPNDNPAHAHFRSDELGVLVAEATAAGLRVMAHAQGTQGIKNAVRAGVRSIEHGIFLDDEAIDLMLAHSTWLVPTLIAPMEVIASAERGEITDVLIIDKAHAAIDAHRTSVSRAISAGVQIAFGTDSGISAHGDNLRELGQLVDRGMTPWEAWRAATVGSATLMELHEKIGTIRPGLTADLMILDGDPSDMHRLRDRVRETWQAGTRTYQRATVTEPVDVLAYS